MRKPVAPLPACQGDALFDKVDLLGPCTLRVLEHGCVPLKCWVLGRLTFTDQELHSLPFKTMTCFEARLYHVSVTDFLFPHQLFDSFQLVNHKLVIVLEEPKPQCLAELVQEELYVVF